MVRRAGDEWSMREVELKRDGLCDADIIDSQRCPLTFNEFTLKEFERDKEERWIDDIPDGNDHSIDAVRYALMDDVLRG